MLLFCISLVFSLFALAFLQFVHGAHQRYAVTRVDFSAEWTGHFRHHSIIPLDNLPLLLDFHLSEHTVQAGQQVEATPIQDRLGGSCFAWPRVRAGARTGTICVSTPVSKGAIVTLMEGRPARC